MKKYLMILLSVLALLSTTSSFAHGWHGGGYYHGGGYGYRGFGFAPFVAGAVVGGAIVGTTYAASAPLYYSQPVVVQQPTYSVQPQYSYAVPRPQFYCPTAQNYYPAVPTCNVPWQQIN